MSSSHTRRSTRIKKFIYGTLNQSLLGKHLITRAFLQTHSIPNKTFHLHKSKNTKLHKDIYGEIIKENDLISTNSSESEEIDVDEDAEEEVNDKLRGRSYFLREHKPLTQRFEIEYPVAKHKQSKYFPLSAAYKSRSQTNNMPTLSSQTKPTLHKRKSKIFFGRSSSTSDISILSSSESINHKRFRQRERKSLLKSRSRCLPLNFQMEDISKSYVLKDRLRIGSSLTDIEPMTIDPNITFQSIGGLTHHVNALKEMVIFPLLYSDVFAAFDIIPPRGVLFYGPPGTGKTLLARALANECGLTSGAAGCQAQDVAGAGLGPGARSNKISFFMRKGSDCLSKWVGESERQLRMLFDQAYKMRPSIIFFDEIDGLAPVRSSRQEQIHNSIVSTFLALLDGLDARSNIVVIGATNRLDAIDPAFRRPGRFDREFMFPMPNCKARERIFRIHMQKWKPPVEQPLVATLASQTTGFTGADIKGLCTEAVLFALRARYPAIYASQQRLPINVNTIKVSTSHFRKAFQVLIPSTLRQNKLWTRRLPDMLAPLLEHQMEEAMRSLRKIFPSLLRAAKRSQDGCDTTSNNVHSSEDWSSDDEVLNYGHHHHRTSPKEESLHMANLLARNFVDQKEQAFKPRFIIHGTCKQGQTSYLGPAILNRLDGVPLHVIDIPALYGCSARMPEEACSEIFREVQRITPSILYLPCINEWWTVLTDTTKAAFTTLLHGLPPFASILILATSDTSFSALPDAVKELFDQSMGNLYEMRDPSSSERRHFFAHTLQSHLSTFRRRTMTKLLKGMQGTSDETQPDPPVPHNNETYQQLGQALPERPLRTSKEASSAPQMAVVDDRDIRELNSTEMVLLRQQEEGTLCELRIFLRDILNQLFRERKFQIFSKPVNPDEVPDYYTIIRQPMDLSEMLNKIDAHHYSSAKDFLADVELICRNALEYNPNHTAGDKTYRHRACALLDTAKSLIYKQLEPEFEKLCQSIANSRTIRGETSEMPPFLKVRPKDSKWPCPHDDPNPGLPSAHHCYENGHRPVPTSDAIDGDHLYDICNGYVNKTKSVRHCPPDCTERHQLHGTYHGNGSGGRLKRLPGNQGLLNYPHPGYSMLAAASKHRKTSIWCRPNRRRRFRNNKPKVADQEYPTNSDLNNTGLEGALAPQQNGTQGRYLYQRYGPKKLPREPANNAGLRSMGPRHRANKNYLIPSSHHRLTRSRVAGHMDRARPESQLSWHSGNERFKHPKFETEVVDMDKIAASPIQLSPPSSLVGQGSFDGPCVPSTSFAPTFILGGGEDLLEQVNIPGLAGSKSELPSNLARNLTGEGMIVTTTDNKGSIIFGAGTMDSPPSIEKMADRMVEATEGWTVEALEKLAFKIMNASNSIATSVHKSLVAPTRLRDLNVGKNESKSNLPFPTTLGGLIEGGTDEENEWADKIPAFLAETERRYLKEFEAELLEMI